MADPRGWLTRAETLWLVQQDYAAFLFEWWCPEWEFPVVWEAPAPRGKDVAGRLAGERGWGPVDVPGTEWRHERFRRRWGPPGDGGEDIGDVVTEPMDFEQAISWVEGHRPRAGRVADASDRRWDWLEARARARRAGGRGRPPGSSREPCFLALMVAFLVYAGVLRATRHSGRYADVEHDSAADAVAKGAGEAYKTVERHWNSFKGLLPAGGGTPWVGDARIAGFLCSGTGRLQRGQTWRSVHLHPPKQDLRLRGLQLAYAGRIDTELAELDPHHEDRSMRWSSPAELSDGDRRFLHQVWMREWLARAPGAFPEGEVAGVRDVDRQHDDAFPIPEYTFPPNR